MSAGNLGSKRVCPKCDAKFYDFGAVSPITCPKCSHSWRDGVQKLSDTKAKKDTKAVLKPLRKRLDDDLLTDVGLPDVEDADEAMDMEPLDDDTVELTSLEEVEEHEEEKDSDLSSDDADDEMFSDMVGEERLVDDLDDHLEDDDEDEEAADADEDDDDRPRSRRR